MNELIFSVLTQALTFLPLALAISFSYSMMRATDMTLDGSFVLGAGVFAHLVTMGVSPIIAVVAALGCGSAAGAMVSLIQRDGKVDSLLAGILAAYILTSLNLVVMGRPNINLLSETTLFSNLFTLNEVLGWTAVGGCCLILVAFVYGVSISRLGLSLRAFGANPALLKRQGKNIEMYRCLGFSLTNLLAAASGCLTAQTVGYADLNMGVGMTLTGVGAILLGQKIIAKFIHSGYFRAGLELTACLIGVLCYFLLMSLLLRFHVDPVCLKMVLALMLIIFIRSSARSVALSGAL